MVTRRGGEAISNVLGNTQGLKTNQLRRIEKLYTRRIPPREIVTQEFARQLNRASSHETRRQIGALIDRKGHVEDVMVGDNRRIELPDFKRVRVTLDRFRGLRFVHTHLRGEELTQDDLTDLALLRLDLMAAIDVDPDTGLPGLLRAAHLLPIVRITQTPQTNALRLKEWEFPAARVGPSMEVGTGGGWRRPRRLAWRWPRTLHVFVLALAASSASSNGSAPVKPYAFLKPAIPSQLDVDFLGLIDSLEDEMARKIGTRVDVRKSVSGRFS